MALSIIQGANLLLPLLVMPFVIRKIGPEGFGVVSVAQVVMIYLSTISDYGFNLTATREIALYRNDRLKISKIFFTVLVSKIIISIVSFALLLVLILFVSFFRDNSLLYLLSFAYVIGQSSLVSWFFHGVEKMEYITVISVLSKLIFVVLIFLFIKNRDDSIFFLFFLGVGNIIGGIMSIYFAIRIFKLKLIRPSWFDITYELKSGWQITITNLSINTCQYINILILRLFSNDLLVGYYSIAEKIYYAIRQILAVFSQAIYPQICQLTQKSKADIVAFFKKIYLPFLFIVMAGCIVVYISTPYLLNLFIGHHSNQAVLLLRLLSYVPIIVCLSIPPYLLLLAFNQKKSYLRVFTLATVISVIASLFFTYFFDARGSVIAIIITEMFIMLGLSRELYKGNASNVAAPKI